jgi:hypothetical protein
MVLNKSPVPVSRESKRQRLFSEGLIDGIVSRLKEIGYAYVIFDLKGYRFREPE